MNSAQIATACREYEQAWENNQNPDIQDFAQRVASDVRQDLIGRLIILEVNLLIAGGEKPSPQAYRDRYPGFENYIDRAFDQQLSQSEHSQLPDPTHSEATSDVDLVDSFVQDYPRQLGRYQVLSELGSGGFGVVCLAQDTTLERKVALKFALKSGFRTEAHVSAFIREARTVAQLQHPGIVTIYDVLQADQWLCIVQQFVDDGDLKRHLKSGTITHNRTVEICRKVADSLAFAHSRGFVHCDIKPANILLDKSGNPFIADFGLAFHEIAKRHKAGSRVGTPRYMPPEVVMGETHRIDSRSDIWCLGVMIYEMLTGKLPFRGASLDEIFDQIRYADPVPPRSIAPSIPRELERVCLKCLSKSVLDRYRTAKELHDDLMLWSSQSELGDGDIELASTRDWEHQSGSQHINRDQKSDTSQQVQVVPRGLQSYNSHDSEFFLQLVPGPRDRHGFPESVRFWRDWVCDNDPIANSVGLVYGPSGSGKSSFVKAALLPRLPDDVVVVYVEATHDETESRTIRALRKAIPGIGREPSLARLLEQIRDGSILPYGKKLLLVFDQFEQWLNDRILSKQEDLVRALRQCDGDRVRALLLVRDDFWLATTRLMSEIEVELQLGRNAKLIDLFDASHAKKVMFTFGHSFGVLPGNVNQLTKAQRRFIDEAVDGLSEYDRVVSIRLAIFAEMFRDRDWTPTELNRMGGAKGVGYKYLESTFDSALANPKHRAFQREARLLLEALMPAAGQQIRGQTLAADALRQACGMQNRPLDFSELIKMLDTDLRLITPVGASMGEESTRSGTNQITHYQLTHDFLVGSLRDWLTQKRRSTRRGRAELCLDERSESWGIKQENRQLPSALEYISIRLLTNRSRWTLLQTRMMRSATKYYGIRLWASVGFITLLLWGVSLFNASRYADSLITRLLQAETSAVPEIVEEMSHVSGVGLRIENIFREKPSLDQRQAFHMELARWQFYQDNQAAILKQLPLCKPLETKALTQIARDFAKPLEVGAAELLKGGDLSSRDRVAIAAALAQWNPTSEHWQTWGSQVARDLVELNSFEVSAWTELLWPVGESLMPTLARSIEQSEQAPEKQIGIYSRLSANSRTGVLHLWKALEQNPPRDDLEGTEYVKHSQRQARLAVAMIGLGENDSRLWNYLRSDENLTRRSYMIEYFAQYQVDPALLVAEIEKSSDSQIIAALLLALGSYRDPSRLPNRLYEFAESSCLTSRDSFVHSAARWLFLATGRPTRSKVEKIPGASWQTQWIDDAPLDLVQIRAPGKFIMSLGRAIEIDSPYWISATEIPIELFQKFDRNYAKPDIDSEYAKLTVTGAHPASGVSWNQAAAYCNWLSGETGLTKDEFCFEIDPTLEYDPSSSNSAPMRLVQGWKSKRGFRLPTEAEWEYACQAENADTWNCGRANDRVVLAAYAWYRESIGDDYSTRSVARLKPNRIGLFDMHGNADEITIDTFSKDQPSLGVIKGGSVFLGSRDIACQRGQAVTGNDMSPYSSFRVVRAK